MGSCKCSMEVKDDNLKNPHANTRCDTRKDAYVLTDQNLIIFQNRLIYQNVMGEDNMERDRTNKTHTH